MLSASTRRHRPTCPRARHLPYTSENTTAVTFSSPRMLAPVRIVALAGVSGSGVCALAPCAHLVHNIKTSRSRYHKIYEYSKHRLSSKFYINQPYRCSLSDASRLSNSSGSGHKKSHSRETPAGRHHFNENNGAFGSRSSGHSTYGITHSL